MKRPAPDGFITSPPQSVSTPRIAVAVACASSRSRGFIAALLPLTTIEEWGEYYRLRGAAAGHGIIRVPGSEDPALRSMLAGAVLSCFVTTAAMAAPRRSDCDGGAYAVVLQAAPAAPSLDARAIWLDATRLRWPGIAPAGRFRLHHSAVGSAVAGVGAPVTGADGALDLVPYDDALPAAVADRFRHVAAGVTLRVEADTNVLRNLHQQQLLLFQEGDDGRVIRATRLQSPGALDSLYAAAGGAELGVSVSTGSTRFALWAPTARNVALCLHRDGSGPATSLEPLRRDLQTGVWSTTIARDLSGQYYTYLVDVHVDGAGLVRNRVTDPYAMSLTADRQRSYIASLAVARD